VIFGVRHLASKNQPKFTEFASPSTLCALQGIWQLVVWQLHFTGGLY
jgi:hypothetical protein